MWYINFEYRPVDMTVHVRSIKRAPQGIPWFFSNAPDELGAYLEFAKHIRENTFYALKEQ
jgi:hypothetical protein